jgi:hypothetical protein
MPRRMDECVADHANRIVGRAPRVSPLSDDATAGPRPQCLGGFRISDAFISPLDLVTIGVLSAEEAKHHHAVENATAATAS